MEAYQVGQGNKQLLANALCLLGEASAPSDGLARNKTKLNIWETFHIHG